jgi:hypothetical protein
MNRIRAFIGVLLLVSTVEASEDWFDRAERALTFSLPNQGVRVQASGLVDLEGYRGEQSTTGFVFTDSNQLFNPRLSLFLDGQKGANWYAFAQFRADRGFDPENRPLRGRLDEFALRWSAAPAGQLNVQVGQFATVIGGWVGRHRSWDNPFVAAPLPYQHMTGAYERRAPASLAGLIPDESQNEYAHNPIIWGPSYTSGIAAFGHAGRLDYAVELKNVGPSASPEAWPITAVGFEQPAINTRIGFRPDPRWRLGASFSDSTYVLPVALRGTGHRPADYREQLFGQDVSFGWHHWQIWAELFEASFGVPGTQRAWTYAGYIETRYKFTPQFFGALRWNRQTFSSVFEGVAQQPWGQDVTRIDAAVTYRITAHAQLKLQATAEYDTPQVPQFHPVYATQFTVRF